MRPTPAEIRAVIALAVGMFCVQVDFFALSLALPQMAVDPNQTTTNMQWVLSADMIAVGATMIPIVYTATILSTTIYLQDGRGLSPLVAGLVFLAPSVAVALSGPLAGRLAAWQPVPLLIPATLVLGGVSLLATSAANAWGAYVPLLG